MENIIEQIFEPQFRQISLRPVSGNNQIKGSGITYRPAPDVGEGYYWVQPIRDLCAVTAERFVPEAEKRGHYFWKIS